MVASWPSKHYAVSQAFYKDHNIKADLTTRSVGLVEGRVGPVGNHRARCVVFFGWPKVVHICA